jgi:phospholipid/cholesterol/gamma-HCH transport system ATP-binding protein
MSSESEPAGGRPRIAVNDLTLAHGDFVVQQDLNFAVAPGEIFVIMGGSGCGKTTLLRHMIGLQRPARGEVRYDGQTYWGADEDTREAMQRRFGVLFQGGALLSSMTLGENVALPLGEFTRLTSAEIADVVGPQAVAGGARRLRGVLSRGAERRHDEAGRASPRHGPRSWDHSLATLEA